MVGIDTSILQVNIRKLVAPTQTLKLCEAFNLVRDFLRARSHWIMIFTTILCLCTFVAQEFLQATIRLFWTFTSLF